jgi:hypothetical protein
LTSKIIFFWPGNLTTSWTLIPLLQFYPLASYYGGNANNDAFLSKFDSNGNLLWAKNMGTSMIDKLGDLDVDPNNNVYVGVSYDGLTAFIDSNVVVTSPVSDFIGISKFTAGGQWVWNKIINGSNNSVLDLNDLAVNANGEVFFYRPAIGYRIFRKSKLAPKCRKLPRWRFFS